jgi:ribose 5-phosphate isomerase B
MKIALGSDHAGFALKNGLGELLAAAGHLVEDVGARDDRPSDYPDFARRVAEAVISGACERGILVCGSGVGASVAANKVTGIRAALCHDTFSARQGVEDDDMNVLCLGARVIGPSLAGEVVRAFLAARFSGAERHVRRVGKIRAIEEDARRGLFDRPASIAITEPRGRS